MSSKNATMPPSLRQERLIILPHNRTLRPYQVPAWRAMDNGIKRVFQVWHRKSGKDDWALNRISVEAFRRVGTYFHVFPTYNQGKKVVWDGLDDDGVNFIDRAFPREVRASSPGAKNEMEMQVKLKNGSVYQIVGSEKLHLLRGPNPVGVVFSEHAYQRPDAWDVFRPILAANGGWAVFNTTPCGRNHAYRLYQSALADPANWFAQILTIEDTFRENGEPIVTSTMVEREIAEGMPRELAMQEYYCSFVAGILGSYWGEVLSRLRQEGHITRVPYDPRLAVHTAWDLGMRASTGIWFFQVTGAERRIIEYWESGGGVSLENCIREVKSRPYIYGRHLAPHDIKVEEYQTQQTRIEFALQHGLYFDIIPKMKNKGEGIEAVSRILLSCWFDATKCSFGLEALENYKRRYDIERQAFFNEPFHDWSSDAADAFQILAMGVNMVSSRADKTPIKSESEFDLFADDYGHPETEQGAEWSPFTLMA